MNVSATGCGRILLAGVALFAAGCVSGPATRGPAYAPPLHAPPGSLVHVYDGRELRYDPALHVYVVVGLPHHYFFNGNYYRYLNDRWYFSRGLDRRWRHYNWHRIPPSLARKYPHR